jgi:arylsulfatase
MIPRLLLAPLILGAIPSTPARAAEAKRPNVVIFLADDLGYSDIGPYGGEIATPNLDRLAAEGLRFTRCYNTARCWSSRAALLTGYYAQQINCDPPIARPKWAALLPGLLRPAGYRSYHSGKWHVDGSTLACGFARSYCLNDHSCHFGPMYHQIDDRRLPPVGPRENYYTTTAIASHALDWLAEHESSHRGQPFFLYVAFTSPHFPLQAPAEDIARYRDRYKAGWDRLRADRLARQKALGIYDGPLSPRDPKTIPSWNPTEAVLREMIGPQEVAYAVAWESLTTEQKEFQATKMAIHAAMVDRIDLEIGRVLSALEASGHRDDTIVLFASDNGASAELIIRGDGYDPSTPPGSAASYLCLGPGWSTAANTPLRLHKSWNHEGGISTPLIVRWPAGIPARGEIRHTPTHFVDIVPTLLELAGLTAPASWNGKARPPLAGRSLVPSFAKDVTIEHPPFFFKHEGNRGLIVGDWKIVAVKGGPWELYDLSRDRIESNDLAASRPNKVRRLAATWSRLDEEYHRQGATGSPVPKAAPKAKRAASK